MGKVMQCIVLTNEVDRVNALGNADTPVRSIEIDALVDTGATMLVLPSDVVDAIGLSRHGTRRAKLADGSVVQVDVAGPIRLSIVGRDMIAEALVMPTGSTALIGQIPLEALDLIVDPKNQECRPNPASPDTPLLDLLSAA
jgi:clan AA aspartic protease